MSADTSYTGVIGGIKSTSEHSKKFCNIFLEKEFLEILHTIPLLYIFDFTFICLRQNLLPLFKLYSSGLVAAAFQLGRGTNYKRFPCWLDHWLCRRNKLGLLSFLCIVVHAVYSMCLTLQKAAGYTLLNVTYHQVSTGHTTP